MPKVGIIVLAYNGVVFLPRCLETLTKTEYPKESLFFILIDNGSVDSSITILQEFRGRHCEFQVEIIHNTKNLGFASGNNVGFKRAKELDLQYVITLNQDIQEVDPAWVTNLVNTLENDPTISCVQARLMRYPQKNIVNSVGNRYHFLGFGYSQGNGLVYTPPNDSVQEVAYASGGALCLRMALIEKFGGFQEETFMYHDDLELGFRYRLLGYRVACNHDAVVYHQYEFSRSIKKYYWMERNRIWFLFEYYSWKTLFLIAPLFFCMELGLLMFSLFNGFFLAKLKSMAFFLVPWHWITILKRRKYIQNIRRVSDALLAQWMTPIITDQEVDNRILRMFGNPLMRVYFSIIKQFL